MKKLAYSYIRFSNQEQGEGDTVRRQTTKAREYAEKKGLTLDEKLTLRDLGISGFTGRNLTHGALGVFMKEVREGRIPAGSYLLVEDVDRLGRLPVMEALSVFQSIIGAGIIVVTLKDEAEYSSATLNGDWTRLLPVLVSMGRGHDESVTKSGRIREGWAKVKRDARDALRPIGDLGPSWLAYTPANGSAPASYTVIKDRVDVIKLIFELCIGGMGMAAISQELRRRDIPSFGGAKRGIGTWSASSLQRLLKSRALLGEYQPYEYVPFIKDGIRKYKQNRVGEPIKGFYPPVIDTATFQKAANALASRRIHNLTRTPKEFNVWHGIVKCAHCGSSLHLSKREFRYLICYKARLGACMEKGSYVRLDVAEHYFREMLVKVNAMSLVESTNHDLEKKILEAQHSLSNHLADVEYYRSKLKEHNRSDLLIELATDAEAAVRDAKLHLSALEGSRARELIVDKEEFFSRLDLISDSGRRNANELLKSLRVQARVNGYAFHIYQQDILLFTLDKDDAGKLRFTPHSDESFTRMTIQDMPSVQQVMDYHQRQRALKGETPPAEKVMSAFDIESDAKVEPFDWTDITLGPYGWAPENEGGWDQVDDDEPPAGWYDEH